jgi:hypothetical protein
MPKEIVHWLVAQRAAEQLSTGPFGPALGRCPNGLKLGAVYHDVLFYLTGEESVGMKELPHKLHGAHGEDTYALLRAQARHLHARQDSPLPTAFFVGLASHIFADAVLHPFVYFHTGNYYDDDPARRTAAIRRHRTLEGLMDMVAAGSPDAARQPSLRQLVQSLEGPLALACPPQSLAALAGVDEQAAAKALTAALDTYCTMQGLFRLETLAQLVHSIAPVLPAKAREIAALFYAPQLWEQRAALSGPLSYSNPVSGTASRASLMELIDLAATRTAAFCLAQAPEIIRSGELAEKGPGPSLDMGLAATPITLAQYFAPRPLLRD